MNSFSSRIKRPLPPPPPARPQVTCLASHFAAICPEARVETLVAMYDAGTEEAALGGRPDYVLDCIDNLETKVGGRFSEGGDGGAVGGAVCMRAVGTSGHRHGTWACEGIPPLPPPSHAHVINTRHIFFRCPPPQNPSDLPPRGVSRARTARAVLRRRGRARRPHAPLHRRHLRVQRRRPGAVSGHGGGRSD